MTKKLDLETIVEFDSILTDILPLWKIEFFDIHKVLVMGAQKYSPDGWLEPDGKGVSLAYMHNSMQNHLNDSIKGNREDWESGLDPLLHLACRALMMYTRIKNNIQHKDDDNGL